MWYIFIIYVFSLVRLCDLVAFLVFIFRISIIKANLFGLYIYVKVSGRFAHITIYLIVNIFSLYVYIVKQKQKMFADFINKFREFSKFNDNFWSFMGTCEVPHKMWARSVQPFWRLLDTNRQTNKQTDKLNLYIDVIDKPHFFLQCFKNHRGGRGIQLCYERSSSNRTKRYLKQIDYFLYRLPSSPSLSTLF